MRVLITGGFGYLGGRIAVELCREPGFMVRLGSREPQSSLNWLTEAETVAMDVLEPKSLPAAVAGVHAVVHLAAMNESECVTDPAKAILVNTMGTLSLLRAAIDAGVERFIYFSTAHVYGVPLVGHITEETLPKPIYPYAVTHRVAEDFVLAAHDRRKIHGIVVRLSNGFGAPAYPNVNRWTLLVNDLCRQAVQSQKLVLRSSGLQQRDFITLTDVGRAVKHILSLPQMDRGEGLFNLGGDNSMSVIDMVNNIAQRCQATMGFSLKIERPEPQHNEKSEVLVYDSGKLKRTGFSLTGRINEEIDRTLLLCA